MQAPPTPQQPPYMPKPRVPTPLLLRRFGKARVHDWYLFALAMRTLLRAGVPFTSAMRTLADTAERERVKMLAERLRDKVNQGIPFAQVLESEGREMPHLMRALILHGQRTGAMVNALDTVISHYEWMIDIRRRVMSVVWYPLALCILGSLVMVARDTAIAGVQNRPIATPFQIAMMRYFMPVVFGGILGWALAWVLSLPRLRYHIDQMFLVAPIFGVCVYKYSLSLFFGTFATALEAGMDLVTGYELSARTCGNAGITEKLLAWSRFLRDGESIATTLKMTKLFDPTALGVIAAGEAAASAPFLLRKLASYYTDEVRNMATNMIKIVAPFTICVVAFGFFGDSRALALLTFILMFFLRLIH